MCPNPDIQFLRLCGNFAGRLPHDFYMEEGNDETLQLLTCFLISFVNRGQFWPVGFNAAKGNFAWARNRRKITE